jgi:hypothetical protein
VFSASTGSGSEEIDCHRFFTELSLPAFNGSKIIVVMKYLNVSLLCFLAFSSLCAEETRPPVYPFDVKVGGQLAVAEEADPMLVVFAKVKELVPADAEVEVSGDGDSIIINVFPVLETGEVPQEAGTQTKVIFSPGGSKIVRLNETMDKSTLSPGLYGMNIVYGGRTSRVMFRVK